MIGASLSYNLLLASSYIFHLLASWLILRLKPTDDRKWNWWCQEIIVTSVNRLWLHFLHYPRARSFSFFSIIKCSRMKENECHVCWWRLTLACKALIRERSRASASPQRIALFFIRACSKRLIRQDVTERASSSLVSICWPFPCSYLWANIKIETEDDRKHVPIP